MTLEITTQESISSTAAAEQSTAALKEESTATAKTMETTDDRAGETLPPDPCVIEVMNHMRQLTILLERETESVLKGTYSMIARLGKEKEELMNSYLRTRHDLVTRNGNEKKWIANLDTGTRAELRSIAYDFEAAMDRNQITLERAHDAVHTVLTTYCQAVRETSFEDALYNASGSSPGLQQIPSVTYRETI